MLGELLNDMHIAAAAAAATHAGMMTDAVRKDGQRVLLAVRLSADDDSSTVTEVPHRQRVTTVK